MPRGHGKGFAWDGTDCALLPRNRNPTQVSFAMDIVYPRMSAHDWLAVAATTLAGACIAGTYGALHDQISYSISPEYFTHMKFRQFGLLGLAARWPRVAAGEVGVLATWWVGALGGWLVARAGRPREWRVSLRALGLCVLTTALVGLAGGVSGAARAQGDLASWSGWQDDLGLGDLKSFVVVAYIHDAGYAGALAGLALAIAHVRRDVRRRIGGLLSSSP